MKRKTIGPTGKLKETFFITSVIDPKMEIVCPLLFSDVNREAPVSSSSSD
jgi:hypothetical protein